MSDAHQDEIAKLEALYAQNPEGRIFTHLAEAYRKAGELERAHEVLAEGIARHPDYSSAHVVLGRVLVDRDRAEEAEAEFRRVLELDPHNMIAIRSLADLARTRGDEGEALEYYNRLLDVEPSDEEARAIVEEMTTGVPTAGETVPADDRTSPDEVDEAPWAAESGWGEHGTAEPPDEYAGDDRPDEAAAADVPVEESEPEPSPWSTEGAGPEPDELPDDFDDAPWATSAPETSASDLEWIGGTELPERDDGIESDMEPVGEGSVGGEAEDPAIREGDTEVRTETIAQVYARQGLYDRAAEVYRELVRTRPDDDRLRERLAEMEQLAARTVEDETAAVEDFSADSGSELFGDRVRDAEPGEIESEEQEAEPEPYAVEGLQTADFDAADVEPASVAGLEIDETDPETGLRSDSGASDGDAWDESRDDAAAVDEPVDEPAEADESIWTAGDWGGDEAGMTPHAWTDEESEADTSSPIRSYFSGLLDWSGTGDTEPGGEPSTPADGPADEPAEAPADASAAGATEPAATEPAATEPAATEPDATADAADPAGGSDDDDDLDMFRSWLESLKQ